MDTVNGIELVSVTEAADRRGVTRHAIYKALREGRLSSVTVLGKTALKVADVDAWESGGHGGRRPGQGRPKKTPEVEASK
jgi:excisionase family DNA binding protein